MLQLTNASINEALFRLQILRRWTAGSAIVLLATTFNLWRGETEFPAVPLFSQLCAAPLWLDACGCVGLCLSLTGLILGSARCAKLFWAMILLFGGLLVTLNQHRLQPWMNQLLIFSAISWLCQPRRALQMIMLLVTSVYIYSAVGKFDAQFLHTVGQQFWSEMLALLGMANERNAQTSVALIALLPTTELLIGLGLLLPRTRRTAGVAAAGFHLLLMLVLGPFGLNHSAGVICWNFQFLGQALILFVLPTPMASGASQPIETPEENRLQVAGSLANSLGVLIAALAMVLPLSERLGYCDHWASWALYAPHSSRTEVYVASAALHELPESLHRIMEVPQESEVETLWVRLPLERWSLIETGSPIYPQARFQLGIARMLAANLSSAYTIKAVVQSSAARWDGSRLSRQYEGSKQIESASSQFWFNSQPRKPN